MNSKFLIKFNPGCSHFGFFIIFALPVRETVNFLAVIFDVLPHGSTDKVAANIFK